MFDKLKKSITKLIGGAFVVLLVLSFAVWGIGDVFRGGTGGDTIVTVGDHEIGMAEAEALLDQELRALRQRSGQFIERDRAMAMGMGQRVLNQLITDRSIEAHAASLGIVLDDATLARIVTTNPAFQVGGRFDKARFDQLLRANGFTEQGYLQLLRRDELRRLMILSMGVAATAPKTGTDLLWKYRNEQRQGRVLLVRADQVQDVATPTEEQLTALLKERQAEFRAPEYRSITLLVMRPQDLVPETEIADEQLRQAYQERRAEFTKPATRDVLQLTGPDEAVLAEARTRIQAGEDPGAVATSLADKGVAAQSLGKVQKGGFPDPAVEEAIFAAPENGVSATTKTAFGNNVMFVIQGATPETETPFEEVRERIRNDLALAQATEDLPQLENAVQDQIAGGASLEDAARTGGFPVRKIEKVDSIGNDPAGKEIDPPLPEQVLRAAFGAAQGVVTSMETLPDGGAFLLRVDAIEPERDRRLDEVRDEVQAAWLADARKARANTIATELLAAVKSGKTLEEAAAGRTDAAVLPIGPLKRNDLGEANELGPQAVERLFAAPVGELPAEPLELEAGYGVLVTDQVIPATPAGEDALNSQIAGEMTSDVVEQYDQALRRMFPPVVHESALAQFMRPTSVPQ
ncbi:MAG TPA: SurA N-terminal domain-containing protein [Geminicoccus sp.]|jgi:peptidyl-prolyl cis-trans isomerase D|uniref:SurA N-terminal domain-containing protein n=1 Tax=Geminicoccus sp. TaxID=2024832 RepID=UPI002E306477|nr:SurA N-terminal domain-containing protein [Geminicoccus sp.]HEX2527680.1 SurA N-terminal domain-containing protein [Geminicoccus sp.]